MPPVVIAVILVLTVILGGVAVFRDRNDASCPVCDGSGKVEKARCSACDGVGVIQG